MVKYDERFKQKVVDAYLAGEGGYLAIARKFGVPSPENIAKWVRLYLKYGRKGLDRKKNNRKYPVQFKIDVIEYKLRTGDSFPNIALNFGIPEPSLIQAWYKVWQSKGIDGLSKPKGRPPISNKSKKKSEKN